MSPPPEKVGITLTGQDVQKCHSQSVRIIHVKGRNYASYKTIRCEGTLVILPLGHCVGLGSTEKWFFRFDTGILRLRSEHRSISQTPRAPQDSACKTCDTESTFLNTSEFPGYLSAESNRVAVTTWLTSWHSKLTYKTIYLAFLRQRNSPSLDMELH